MSEVDGHYLVQHGSHHAPKYWEGVVADATKDHEQWLRLSVKELAMLKNRPTAAIFSLPSVGFPIGGTTSV